MSVQSTGYLKQLIPCIKGCMPLFMAGTALGWSSPMLEYVSNGKSPVQLNSSQESWMVTIIDFGNILLCIPAGILMDRIGRKMCVYLTAPLSLTGWILILTARQAWYLYIARFLHGCAMAVAFVVCPAYVGEMANASVRGSLAMLVELTYGCGLLTSYLVGWIAEYDTLAIVCGSIPVITVVLMIPVPESPYYLMMVGKSDEASRSLRRLRSYDEKEFGKELEIVRLCAMEEKSRKVQLTTLIHRDRVPLIIMLTLSVLQMACGGSVMEAYASSVLKGTQLSPNACAMVVGLCMAAAWLPFALIVDRYGRRPLFLVSLMGATLCYAFVAVMLSQDTTMPVVSWLLLVSICGAVFSIHIGIMPLVHIVQCEYFPSDTRAAADSVAMLVITSTSAVMLKLYQPVSDEFGKRTNFIAYAVISFFGCLFCYFWVPETKGKTFKQIQTDFETYAWFGSKRYRDYERI